MAGFLSALFLLINTAHGGSKIDKQFKEYSAREYIAQKRRETLAIQARQKMSAIALHMAKSQSKILRKQFSSQSKKNREKVISFHELNKLLELVSPIDKNSKNNKDKI